MRLQAHFCGCPKSVCVAKNRRRRLLSRGCHGAHRSEGRALLAVVCGARPGTDARRSEVSALSANSVQRVPFPYESEVPNDVSKLLGNACKSFIGDRTLII